MSPPTIGPILDLYINVSWIIPPTRRFNSPPELCIARPFHVVIVALSYSISPLCSPCYYLYPPPSPPNPIICLIIDTPPPLSSSASASASLFILLLFPAALGRNCARVRVLHLLLISYLSDLICSLLFTLIVFHRSLFSTLITPLCSSCSDILSLHRPFLSANIRYSCSTLFCLVFFTCSLPSDKIFSTNPPQLCCLRSDMLTA